MAIDHKREAAIRLGMLLSSQGAVRLLARAALETTSRPASRLATDVAHELSEQASRQFQSLREFLDSAAGDE